MNSDAPTLMSLIDNEKMKKLFAVSAVCMTAAALFLPSTSFARAATGVAGESPFMPSTNIFARRLVTKRFELVDGLRGIDPAVLRLFYAKIPRGSIASGKQVFEATDAESDVNPGRPRRFNFAGHTLDLWFIVYEVGGRAYHHTILFFQKSGNRWRRGPAAVGMMDGSNFSSLVRALRKGWFSEVHDNLNL